jgi:excisionase family DNA binding protein
MAKAYSVARLAEEWGCSRRSVYTLIDEGKLHAFSIGKRGMRISEDEKTRWERESGKSTETETVPSDDARTAKPLPTSAMKMISVTG